MKVARDKGFERLRKLEIGKNSHRICEVNKRHKRAMALLKKDLITNVQEKQWIVASETTPQVNYTVSVNLESCSCMVNCST